MGLDFAGSSRVHPVGDGVVAGASHTAEPASHTRRPSNQTVGLASQHDRETNQTDSRAGRTGGTIRLPLPAWHEQILREDTARAQASPREGRPWPEVLQRIVGEK